MTKERDDNTLAAEYVFGLLAKEVRAEVDRRIGTDASFARKVELWRVRFAEFDETADETIPSDEIWSRIERDIASAPPDAPASITDLPNRFWSSLRALRIATVASALAAIAFAVLALSFLQHAHDVAARKPVYVAILVNESTKQAGAVVNAFADGRVEMVPLTDIVVPEGKALQIWTLWDRSIGPRSVGLISRAQTTRLNLDKLPATSADQLFEITLEPVGGSPINRPTGPILFKGTTSRAL